MTYYRVFKNSGITTIYADGVTYQIDWVLIGMGAADGGVILNAST